MTLEELRDLIGMRSRDDAAEHSESEEVVVLVSQGDAGLTQCPVCGERLPGGDAATAHVNRCLDGGAPARHG